MRKYVFTAAVVALVLPAAAAAKGPTSATISGPGLEHSLVIRGDGGEGPGTALGTLASTSGYFAQMFGESPDPTLTSRPQTTLGPRYKAVYVVPGPNDKSRVVQYIYPYAKRGAVTFMKRGQRFWNGRKAHGGWYRASARLKAVLVRAGLPATAP